MAMKYKEKGINKWQVKKRARQAWQGDESYSASAKDLITC